MKIQINYTPFPWQKEFHKALEKYNRAILVCHRRSGKAQPLSAKVLTPSGFTTMGQIKIGDEVLTPKGTIAHVIGVFPQPKQQIYKLLCKMDLRQEQLQNIFGKFLFRIEEEKMEYSILST